MNEITNPVLEQAANAFKSVRTSLMEGARLLYHIEHDRLWQGPYNSFNEYVEQGCQISHAQASRLMTVYEIYVLRGNLSMLKTQTVDPEKLYIARNLEGTVEEKLIKAETLTRSELKQERAMKDEVECQHLTTIHICANCHIRIK